MPAGSGPYEKASLQHGRKGLMQMKIKGNFQSIFMGNKDQFKLMGSWGHGIKKVIFKILFYLLLFDLAFVFLYPFIIMIVDSLKTDGDLYNITVKWIPSKLEFNNYVIAFKKLNYFRYLKNSIFVATAATLGHLLSCASVGYGFARYQFKGKGILFAIVILAIIVPVQVIIFPLYMQYSNWDWVDSFLPIIVPSFFGFGLSGGFFIFLFRQFFSSLPYEMEEAARIDGCGAISTFFRIMMPMARSSLLVGLVLSMVWHWNDYFEPNVYISSHEKFMLPSRLPVLYGLLNSEEYDAIMVNDTENVIFNFAMLMAATFLVILPILIIYAFLQKNLWKEWRDPD
jgi:multiple sugar transport system permease protein